MNHTNCFTSMCWFQYP